MGEFAALKRPGIALLYAQEFQEDVADCIITNDEAFVTAAVLAMCSTPPPFRRHMKHPAGHLLEVNSVEHPDIGDVYELCEKFNIPEPSEFLVFYARKSQSSADHRFVVVDMVPDFISAEDVLCELAALEGAGIDSWCEEDVAEEFQDFMAWGLHPRCGHRNIIVKLKCDVDELGSVLSRGLRVWGLYFRVRRHFGTPEHPVEFRAPRCAPLPLVRASKFTQTKPVTSPAGAATASPPPRPPLSDGTSQTAAVTSLDQAVQTRPPSSPPPAAAGMPAGRGGRRPPSSTPPVKQKTRARPKQCYRCQQWGHTSNTCTAPPACRSRRIISELSWTPQARSHVKIARPAFKTEQASREIQNSSPARCPHRSAKLSVFV
ncbi:putative serine/threonine-protein kinase tsuA [Frankliniella fusca]|uniref:Serine/threonine-protein kinase tsuA n=1 Tax=Frankliniella fusca TaxID=407009 RepID=A0AAE1LH48_9NEOP|nr:putative serine/threonine-protein kinase tsuA [Frankliniella fusca]